MARSTDELRAALRRRYENTDQLMASIAAEFDIGLRTLGRMVSVHGWRKRSLRTQGLPIAVQLLEEAKALTLPSAHSRDSGNPDLNGKEELGPRFRGDERMECAYERENPSPLDRLEALVVKEIDAEEAAHAQRRGKHSVAKASERSARTLATLTQTLHTLQRMRAGLPTEHESYNDDIARARDLPRDIDEFRRDLARRIDAFVASRTDNGNAGGNTGPEPLDGPE
jgi:hypothetical protein